MSEINPIEGLDLLPQPIVIITVGDAEDPKKRNAMTAAWITRVSWDPPLVAVSIAPSRYTYELLKEYKEFAINIVSRRILNIALSVFGALSGRHVDKFSRAGVEPIKAKKIRAPVLKEAPIVIECKLIKTVEVGDHILAIGEVLAVYRNSDETPVVWFDDRPRELIQ